MESNESDLESRLKAAEARASEAEKNMLQAASFGKQLLSEKEELNREIKELSDKLSSVQYNGSMKEETQSLTIKSLEQDLESLRKEMLNKENAWLKERESLKRVTRKVIPIQDIPNDEQDKEELAKIQTLQDEIQILRKELNSCYASNQSKDDSILGYENEELLKENENLKEQLRIFKDELAKNHEELEEIRRSKSSLQNEIREKDEEIQCYLDSLDSARNSAQDLHQEIESLQMGETNLTKGNSLFSEVEDRRNFVEQKLQVLQAKNFEMKKVIDEKTKQIHKVKMQNLALLNMADNGYKTGSGVHVQRLEQQLSTERQINKSLRDSIELMSSSTPCVISQDKTSDYAYMSSLLQEKASQIDELKKQLQSQIRQTLEEGDKVQEYSRKLMLQESQIARFKAEIYQLKMMVEDLKAEKSKTPPIQKAKNKNRVIVEDIKFEEDSKIIKAEPSPFELKDSLYDMVDRKENKENVAEGANRFAKASEGSSKKSVSMCQKVTVIDENLSKEEEELKNDAIHTKSLPRRTPKAQSAISIEEHDREMKDKCAQQ